MPLLLNNDLRIHHRCERNTYVVPAIQGPWRREWDMDTLMSYVLGVAIVLAVVVTCLDITIWRP